MAGEDPQYTAWLRTRPCQAPGPHDCRGVEIHHPCHLRATGHDKRRAHDHRAVRLCLTSHVPGIHQLAGPFRGMQRDQVRAFCDRAGEANRARYLDEAGVLEVSAVPW